MSVRINPSILSADFVNLERDLGVISSADFAHIDVMDNHFVPNLTFGPQMVGRLHEVSPIPLDVHLMIENPERWAPTYAELGAFSVTFHAESTSEPVALARRLRAIGARAGLAVKPGTDIVPYLDLLPEFDQILVMTVEPGFGGQAFISDVMPKLDALAAANTLLGLDVWLQVDGGITLDTIVIAAEHGANTFVAGSSVYNAPDRDQAILELRHAAEAASAHRH